MNAKLIARPPLQERSRLRVGLILEAAERLLHAEGLSGFSIPVLAEQLSYPRATIYKFFPTPYALLNTLAERHLEALEKALYSQAENLMKEADWRGVTRRMVEAAAGYYREQPVACILLLGGPVTDESYRSLEYTINRLGKLTHNMLQQAGLNLAENPCEAALAIEYGTASFRFSYFLHQTITPEYIEAAGDVMIAFIERRLKLGA
ncbi:MAG: TetR/AcrR family transcriptional regulator [Pseudomonadota bacterium]